MQQSDYSTHYFPDFPDTLFVVDNDTPGCLSVTNDSANVVAAVLRHPEADGGRTRIVYRDSTKNWDELKHDGARFVGFAPICPQDHARFVEAFRRLK